MTESITEYSNNDLKMIPFENFEVTWSVTLGIWKGQGRELQQIHRF